MSWIVFLIAAVPAAAVAWVGWNKTSRALLYGTFALAVAVGLFTGHPAFMGVDIFFALIGLCIGHIVQTRSIRRARVEASQRPPPPPPDPPPIAKSESQNHGVSGWVWLVVGLGFLGYKFMESRQQPVPVHSSPSAYSPPAPYPPQLKSAQANAAGVVEQGRLAPQRASQTQNKQPRTLEQCLRLKSDAAMARCLEKAP